MGHASGKNCGACTSAEVQALFCELINPETTAARASAIRAHLAECDECTDRLQREEVMRELLRTCCGKTKAPQELRQRISIQITRTEIRYR